MQALSIYILIRLDEGETQHNDFDSLLLTTITASPTRLYLLDLSLMIEYRS
jgi:hypothetical protein